MLNQYSKVTTRFLREDERLVLSKEKEMPLVIEAKDNADLNFLQQFLVQNSAQLLQDMAVYGAVLLRGFKISSDEEFEQTLLSIPEFKGISDAFMAENGRTSVGNLKYVLHTNSVYKTGGTLYLGGFHTENYYSTDVPGYLFFYCAQPSTMGGETGLINTQKLYESLNVSLQQKIEKKSFLASMWLVSEVAKRYQLPLETVEKISNEFHLPRLGVGKDQFLLMYKPSVFIHPLTQEKSLQINLFELPTLNKYLRKCFLSAYKGKNWFWHRFFWRLPAAVFNSVEFLAVAVIAFFHSPQKSFTLLGNKLATYFSKKKINMPLEDKIETCFTKKDIKNLAQSMRDQYCSCLWQKGDVLLIDNRKVMHAGMPGKGDRLIRAMIANPIAMSYSPKESGLIYAQERTTVSLGARISDPSLKNSLEKEGFLETP